MPVIESGVTRNSKNGLRLGGHLIVIRLFIRYAGRLPTPKGSMIIIIERTEIVIIPRVEPNNMENLIYFDGSTITEFSLVVNRLAVT